MMSRRTFIGTTLSRINQKYGLSMQTTLEGTLFGRGGIDYPLAFAENFQLQGSPPQAAAREFYQAMADYDYGRFVGSTTPGLNPSLPRIQFIDSLIRELRQKYGVRTLYYWGNPPIGASAPWYVMFESGSASGAIGGSAFNSALSSAFSEFNQRLAAYDSNPPATPAMSSSAASPIALAPGSGPPGGLPGIPSTLPPGVPPPVPPGFAPPIAVPQYAAAAPVQATGWSPSAPTPASFLSAFEIAEARAREPGLRPANGSFLLASSSIDLSALRDPANLSSTILRLGTENLTSCFRIGLSGYQRNP